MIASILPVWLVSFFITLSLLCSFFLSFFDSCCFLEVSLCTDVSLCEFTCFLPCCFLFREALTGGSPVTLSIGLSVSYMRSCKSVSSDSSVRVTNLPSTDSFTILSILILQLLSVITFFSDVVVVFFAVAQLTTNRTLISHSAGRYPFNCFSKFFHIFA